jgi:hypothetical protein
MLRSQRFPVRIGILAAVLTLASWLSWGLPVLLTSIPPGFAQESAPNGTIIQGYAGVSIEAVSNITGNYVAETSGVYASNLMGSFQGFKGVGATNQAAGNLNNQGTYIGFAETGSKNALMTTNITLATITANNRLDTTEKISYKAKIGDKAFNGATGIVAVNQAAGNMNSQLNAVTVCMGNAAAVLNNTQLSRINSNNTINTPVKGAMPSAEVSLADDTFQNFKGVASVSQVAGNYNQVVTSIRININSLP